MLLGSIGSVISALGCGATSAIAWESTFAGTKCGGQTCGLRRALIAIAIHGTQGLDDAHIVVTVQDESGKALSNSPDVTLTIVSGPGKFPTGRSINFSNKSMVAIRDGQAAITFRSYEAGESVIEATSPGLKPARITITRSHRSRTTLRSCDTNR